MASATRQIRNVHQRAFVSLFESLNGRYSGWTIWSDFVTMAAIEISNAVDQLNAPQRIETYLSIKSKYQEFEQAVFAQMLSEMIMGLEENADQDFLGELFMLLELSSDCAGQFFTPYCVCRMMAMMQTDAKARIQQNGWISVNDCACGAGALLIAFANECTRQQINYQTSVLFVAQDISFVAGCMCYLQLSLLGCVGYVVIADTIRNPATSYDERGLIPRDAGNVWYTPMYFLTIWHNRRLWEGVKSMCQPVGAAVKHAAAEDQPGKQELQEGRYGQLNLF